MVKRMTPVILSGGAGTRLWPLSTNEQPKQFHALSAERSLLQETVMRFPREGGRFTPPVLLANGAHAALIQSQMEEIGIAPEGVFLEPEGRNTAPAIAALAAAFEREDSDRVLIVTPADHAIADGAAFVDAISRAGAVAADGDIVLLGIKPTRPETGYGYIEARSTTIADVLDVVGFKEKPTAEIAKEYVEAGAYFWNAGVFVFRADAMAAAMREHCPQLFAAAEKAVTRGSSISGALHLDPRAYAECENISIDYAVMEKADRLRVVPLDAGWSDIGSWDAIHELGTATDAGVAIIGEPPVTIDCANMLTVADGVQIAALGVSDLIVVATSKTVLVAKRGRSQDVKKLVEEVRKRDTDAV